MASRVAISRTPRIEVRLTPPRARAPRPFGQNSCPALTVNREAEVDAAVTRVEPARGDYLAAGVEVDAFGAVHVRVTEQRGLPAAERVISHRHRDRHVHADHADLGLG